MFSKIDVNGEGAAPLYQRLTDGTPITWNFAKFLIGKDGEVVRRYEPKVTPEQIAVDVAELLG